MLKNQHSSGERWHEKKDHQPSPNSWPTLYRSFSHASHRIGLAPLFHIILYVPVYLTWPHRLTDLLYLSIHTCKCQLFTDKGSRRLQKHLNYCFSVLASTTNQSIWVYLTTQVYIMLLTQVVHACGRWQFSWHKGEPCGFDTFLCVSVATHVTARSVRVITMKCHIRFGSVQG